MAWLLTAEQKLTNQLEIDSDFLQRLIRATKAGMWIQSWNKATGRGHFPTSQKNKEIEDKRQDFAYVSLMQGKPKVLLKGFKMFAKLTEENISWFVATALFVQQLLTKMILQHLPILPFRLTLLQGTLFFFLEWKYIWREWGSKDDYLETAS